jgi:hypothetical protein
MGPRKSEYKLPGQNEFWRNHGTIRKMTAMEGLLAAAAGGCDPGVRERLKTFAQTRSTLKDAA